MMHVLSFLIEKIYVYHDKIVLNMYYSEDAREVDFVEMNKYYDNIDNIMSVLSEDSVDTTYQEKLNTMLESMLDDEESAPF